MSYKIDITLSDDALQRINNICSIKDISEREALIMCITTTYFLINKQQEGYNLLLQKDEDIQQVVLPKFKRK